MELVHVKKNDLKELFGSQDFLNISTFPVTRHRAKSQAENPRGKSDDTVLIYARENNELLGYIGALPDKILFNKKEFDIAWNSCWWVHPQKGKKITMALLSELLRSWNENICFSDLEERAKEIIRLTGFYNLKEYPESRYFFRSYLNVILPDKYPVFKNFFFRFGLLILDNIMNLIFSAGKIYAKKITDVNIKEEVKISDEAILFMEKFPGFNISKRSKKEFDWIIDNPWILTDKETYLTYKNKYYFSYWANSFCNKFLEFRRNGNLVGVIMIQERNMHFRTPYVFIEEPDEKEIMQELFNYLSDSKALSFVTRNKQINNFLNYKRYTYIKKSTNTRYAAFPKKFGDIDKNCNIQDGDGDAVFC